MAGVKLLICGLERSGKTTLCSTIEDGFVLSFDAKQYPYKVPHWNINKNEYGDIETFRTGLQQKMAAYVKKFGKTPKTIVWDTVTQLYNMCKEQAYLNAKGWEVWNMLDKEILGINRYIEDNLVANNVNVVVVAHTQLDKDTGKYYIPADGSFKKTGSWLSVVDNASYSVFENDAFKIIHKNLQFPCRSTLGDELPIEQSSEEYDINKHIAMLEANKLNNAEYEF